MESENKSLEKLRNDYKDFLNEYGFTQELVDMYLEMDTIDYKDSENLLELKDSEIAGKGMFAIRDICENEYIAMGKVNGSRAMAGRYTNHSPNPNAIFLALDNGDVSMFSVLKISEGEEVTVDYRQAIEATKKSIKNMEKLGNEVLVEVLNSNSSNEIMPLTGTRDEVIDVVESVIAQHQQVECPLIHRFTNNMYIREVFVPASTLVTSKIHKEEHPFVVSQGAITLWDGEGGQLDISAPYCGITKENTRRVAYTHTDCVFTTFHVTDKKTVQEVEDEIFLTHDNPLLDENIKKLLKLK